MIYDGGGTSASSVGHSRAVCYRAVRVCLAYTHVRVYMLQWVLKNVMIYRTFVTVCLRVCVCVCLCVYFSFGENSKELHDSAARDCGCNVINGLRRD